jgi:hypothetical protein
MQAALTIEQANAIIDVVEEAGIYEPPRPTDGDAVIKSAAEVIKQAETAKRAGVKVPAVIRVLDLASPLNNIPSYDSIDSTEPATATDDPPFELDNDSSEDTAAISTDAKSLKRDQEQESSHYLDLTDTIDIPNLPRDFSKVGDLELRTLHAERHYVLSKCIFELGLEESDYQSAQLNYETEYKRCMLGIDGKVTDKRDQSFLAPTVIDWRAKVGAHHKKVIMLRAYKELLESEIRGLSREFTMRTGERVATP